MTENVTQRQKGGKYGKDVKRMHDRGGNSNT